jgi:hypothetical protein
MPGSLQRMVSHRLHLLKPNANYIITVSTAKYSDGTVKTNAAIFQPTGRAGQRMKRKTHVSAKTTKINTPGNWTWEAGPIGVQKPAASGVMNTVSPAISAR